MPPYTRGREGRSQEPSGRPSWRYAFFVQRRLTSKLKHLTLECYVKEFAYHLGSVRPLLYYVDGFAGPGTYRKPNGQIESGSPVLIAELARRLRETNAPFQLKCLNVEADPRLFRELEEATAQFTPDIVEKNYPSSFAQALPDILRRIGAEPTFFFIDPFGVKGIPFADLLPIFNRQAVTEVLITFHTDGIAKKAGYFALIDDPHPRNHRLAQVFTHMLAGALSVRWDELRSWWQECMEFGRGGTDAFEGRVLRHYLTHLRSPNTTFRFTKALPAYYYKVNAPPGDQAPVCFHLIFGTRHKQGLYEMNNCMVGAVRRFYNEEYSHTFFPLFREQLDEANAARRLQGQIPTRFAGTPFTIDEVKQELMQDTSLLVGARGYREAVIRLLRAGRLRQIGRGRINNETRFEVIS